MLTKVGSFAKSTNTGVPVDQAITGVGFKPKVLFVWATLQTAAGAGAPHGIGVGVAVGTTAGDQIGSFVWAADAVSTTQANRCTNQTVMQFTDNNTASTSNRVADGTVKSLDPDGFTLTWTTNNATGYQIGYLAIGGDEVQAKLVNYTNAAGTGNRAFTGAGFRPDACLFFGSGHTAWPSQANAANIGVGAAVSSSKRWAWAINSVNGVTMAATTQAAKTQRTDSCVLLLGSTGSSVVARMDYVSADADGCTLNVVTNPGGGSLFVLYLKGGWWDAGSFAKPTGGNGSANSVSLGRKPKAVMVQNFAAAATTSVLADATHSWGAVDQNGTEGCAVGYHQDGVLPAVCKSHFVTDKSTRLVTGATTNAEADVTPTSAGMDFAWGTNNATAAEILWLAMGEEEPAPFFAM